MTMDVSYHFYFFAILYLRDYFIYGLISLVFSFFYSFDYVAFESESYIFQKYFS